MEILSILDRIWEICGDPFTNEDGVVLVERENQFAAIEENLRAISQRPQEAT